jgi:hypothetical protein
MGSKENWEKKDPGRPRIADPHLVLTTADVLRTQLSYAWPLIGNQFLSAKTPEEILSALKNDGEMIGGLKDLDFATRIFEIIQDPLFPYAREKSQIAFLADSLGAGGVVTARRSREICAKARKKVRHVIVRREFYIECSCGYKGPARDRGCPTCGTGELSDELMLREDDSGY